MMPLILASEAVSYTHLDIAFSEMFMIVGSIIMASTIIALARFAPPVNLSLIHI